MYVSFPSAYCKHVTHMFLTLIKIFNTVLFNGIDCGLVLFEFLRFIMPECGQFDMYATIQDNFAHKESQICNFMFIFCELIANYFMECGLLIILHFFLFFLLSFGVFADRINDSRNDIRSNSYWTFSRTIHLRY